MVIALKVQDPSYFTTNSKERYNSDHKEELALQRKIRYCRTRLEELVIALRIMRIKRRKNE